MREPTVCQQRATTVELQTALVSGLRPKLATPFARESVRIDCRYRDFVRQGLRRHRHTPQASAELTEVQGDKAVPRLAAATKKGQEVVGTLVQHRLASIDARHVAHIFHEAGQPRGGHSCQAGVPLHSTASLELHVAEEGREDLLVVLRFLRPSLRPAKATNAELHRQRRHSKSS